MAEPKPANAADVLARLKAQARKARSANTAAKRKAKREELFPGSSEEIYDLSAPETAGYSRTPRVLPLVARLINELPQPPKKKAAEKSEGGQDEEKEEREKKVNAGALFLVLWAYDFGQGFVEVRDQMNMLYEAGLSVSLYRAERSWNERIEVLVEHGFIRTKASGLVEHGFILLRDPHRAVMDLHRAGKLKGENLERWFDVFKLRAIDVGVDLSKVVPVPELDLSGPEFDYLKDDEGKEKPAQS